MSDNELEQLASEEELLASHCLTPSFMWAEYIRFQGMADESVGKAAAMFGYIANLFWVAWTHYWNDVLVAYHPDYA